MQNSLFKFKTLVFSLLAISSTLSAIQEQYYECIQATTPFCEYSQPILEVKTGYFFFSDSKMRKIYDRGGVDVQLCTSYPLWNLTDSWTLDAYAGVEYFQRSGKSMNGNQNTSLWSVPINIGLKPVYAINANTHYYLAIGPRYYYIQQRNHSSYVYKNKSKKDLGFFVNTGFHYFLCDQFVFDIFGEYSYAKTRFHNGRCRAYTRNIQIGGFTFGGGLGYTF